MRDLEAAAESRRNVQKATISEYSFVRKFYHWFRPHEIAGGLWHTKNGKKQEYILLKQIYKLLLVLSDSTIPIILLKYPILVKEPSYLYNKLKEILLKDISFDTFSLIFNDIVRPEFVHKFNKNDI